MYTRIVNKLDAKLLLKEISEKDVGNRICELIEIMDDAYGEKRNRCDMGGYILFFPDINSYEQNKEELYKFYNIQKEDKEYMDLIAVNEKGNMRWYEELYIVGTENSLLWVYPVMKGE